MHLSLSKEMLQLRKKRIYTMKTTRHLATGQDLTSRIKHGNLQKISLLCRVYNQWLQVPVHQSAALKALHP